MTTTYSRARGVVPHENGTEQRGGPPIVRNAFGPSGRADKNNSSSSSASISSSIGKAGGSSAHARLGSTAVNGGHSLAYTYAPLEHSSDSSWHQIPKSLASAVLGVDPCSTASTAVGDHAAGGDGGGGSAGGAMSHQSKTYQMAVKRTVMSVALSCCFGFATMVFRGRQSGLEFFAGYLVEQSLSEYEIIHVTVQHVGRVRCDSLSVYVNVASRFVCGGTFDCCPAAATTCMHIQQQAGQPLVTSEL